MAHRGTASISGAYVEFQVAILKALPRDISDDVALALAKDGDGLTLFLAGLTSEVKSGAKKPREVKVPTSEPLTYPATGEVFELTLDGDAADVQPLKMVRRDGYAGEWRHRGSTVKGQEARRFKLVEIGYCQDFEEVRRKLATHGAIPEGQWREAFKARYPRRDGKGPIGVADASWVSPGGDAGFPYVHTDGDSRFGWAGNGFGDSWRWLVLCK